MEAAEKRAPETHRPISDASHLALSAARAAKADEPDNGLRVFEDLTIRAECPRCGRPVTVRIDLVESAAEPRSVH